MFEVPAGAKAWLVVFHTQSARWVERWCPGRFKHVSMAGFLPEARAWIVLSWELGRMRAGIVRDDDFEAWLSDWAGPGAGVLRAAAPDFDTAPWRPRLGLFCVPMVAHVLGLRGGALLPGRLWSLLVRQGAEILTDGRPNAAQGIGKLAAVGAGDGAGGGGGEGPARRGAEAG